MMSQLENELYPLTFEEVDQDNPEQNPFGLPGRRQATYETLYIGEGKSIEPIQMHFYIYANETVDQTVIDDLLVTGIEVECSIQPAGVDEVATVVEDELSTAVINVVQTDEVIQDLNIDDTLVFTFEVDEQYQSKLPNNCQLSFTVDPKITPGIKHLYTFGKETAQIKVDVEISRGKVKAEINSSGGRRVISETMSSSETVRQTSLQTSPPGPHFLSISAESEESIYKISGTREIRFDGQPDSVGPNR
jgi:hypothetical protein